MLRRSIAGAVAAVAVAAALGACTSEDHSEIGFGGADRSMLKPIAFNAVSEDDCLGDSVPLDGMVPTIDCAEPGALAIEAVVTVGPDAPSEQPADAVVIGYATAACESTVQAYAEERGIPVTGLLQVAVVPEDQWQGPDTPVVCAVSAL